MNNMEEELLKSFRTVLVNLGLLIIRIPWFRVKSPCCICKKSTLRFASTCVSRMLRGLVLGGVAG